MTSALGECRARFVDRLIAATAAPAYALLSDGLLEDDMGECPLHGGCFNVKTGKALCEPAEVDLRVYPTRLVENRIEICVT